MATIKEKANAENICLNKPIHGRASKISEGNNAPAKPVLLYEAGAHFQYVYLCKELEMLKKKIECKGSREVSFIELNLSVSSSETKKIVNSFANSLNFSKVLNNSTSKSSLIEDYTSSLDSLFPNSTKNKSRNNQSLNLSIQINNKCSRNNNNKHFNVVKQASGVKKPLHLQTVESIPSEYKSGSMFNINMTKNKNKERKPRSGQVQQNACNIQRKGKPRLSLGKQIIPCSIPQQSKEKKDNSSKRSKNHSTSKGCSEFFNEMPDELNQGTITNDKKSVYSVETIINSSKINHQAKMNKEAMHIQTKLPLSTKSARIKNELIKVSQMNQEIDKARERIKNYKCMLKLKS